METIRILGIDPGLSNTGWGIIDSRGTDVSIVDYGNIVTKKNTSHAERLHIIHKALVKVVRQHRPEVMAVESLYFARNVKSAMAVAEARGVAILAGTSAGASCVEYTPLQIKQAVVGYGSASKDQVTRMVQAIAGMQDAADTSHAADALAAAVCHSNFLKIKI